MSERPFTLIFYYVPEDKDELDVPNAFGIKKSLGDIRLGDIQSQFPLEGQYHFRFKFKHGNEYVWLDLMNPNCKLPTFDGKVTMKVTRKTWGNEGNSKSYSSDGEKIPAPEIPMAPPTKTSQPAKKGILLEGLDSPKLIPDNAPTFEINSLPGATPPSQPTVNIINNNNVKNVFF